MRVHRSNPYAGTTSRPITVPPPAGLAVAVTAPMPAEPDGGPLGSWPPGYA
jgi:hypothetical protein